MSIKLKNYTTDVAAASSIDRIEKLLQDFGASNTMKEFAEIKPLAGQHCVSLSFIINVEGMKMPFKLPANVEKVIKWLKTQKPNSAEKTVAEQAQKIAWKQQYELLHLQLGQIEMNQVEKLEVLLPYLYDVKNQQSYYEKLKKGGFKQLTLQ